jgi:hypothetical protein
MCTTRLLSVNCSTDIQEEKDMAKKRNVRPKPVRIAPP